MMKEIPRLRIDQMRKLDVSQTKFLEDILSVIEISELYHPENSELKDIMEFIKNILKRTTYTHIGQKLLTTEVSELYHSIKMRVYYKNHYEGNEFINGLNNPDTRFGNVWFSGLRPMIEILHPTGKSVYFLSDVISYMSSGKWKLKQFPISFPTKKKKK